MTPGTCQHGWLGLGAASCVGGWGSGSTDSREARMLPENACNGKDQTGQTSCRTEEEGAAGLTVNIGGSRGCLTDANAMETDRFPFVLLLSVAKLPLS